MLQVLAALAWSLGTNAIAAPFSAPVQLAIGKTSGYLFGLFCAWALSFAREDDDDQPDDEEQPPTSPPPRKRLEVDTLVTPIRVHPC